MQRTRSAPQAALLHHDAPVAPEPIVGVRRAKERDDRRAFAGLIEDLPPAPLAAVFVAFGLAHRNRRSTCAGCSDDCDKSSCEKRT